MNEYTGMVMIENPIIELLLEDADLCNTNRMQRA